MDVAGTLSATNAAVDVKKGNVNVSGELKADNTKVTLPADGTASVNTLSGKNATIVFNQIKDGVVTVTTNKAENLKVSAGGELTAKYGTAEALVKALGEKTIAVYGKTYTLAGEESDLTSTWELDANGKVTYANGAAESPVLPAAKHANAANLAQ